jgi:hypothetical protein
MKVIPEIKSKGSSVSGITFIRYAQIENLESQIT